MRQSESVKSQQGVVRGDQKDKISIEAVKSRRPRSPSKKTTRSAPKPQRCGRSPLHDRQQCPANQAVCHKCHKRGHFRRCCKSRGDLNEVKQDRDSEDSQSEFLGTISADAVNSSKPWMAMLKLNNRALEFKVDTCDCGPGECLQPHRAGASLHSLERSDRGDVGGVWSIHRTTRDKREDKLTRDLRRTKSQETVAGETGNPSAEPGRTNRASRRSRHREAFPRAVRRPGEIARYRRLWLLSACAYSSKW